MKKTKYLLIGIITLLIMTVSVSAQQNERNQNMDFIAKPMVVSKNAIFNPYDIEVLMEMNYQQLEILVEDNLNRLIKLIDSGSEIYWIEDYVESVIKVKFPELYDTVKEQMNDEINSAMRQSLHYSGPSGRKNVSEEIWQYSLVGQMHVTIYFAFAWTTEGKVSIPIENTYYIAANDSDPVTGFHKSVTGNGTNNAKINLLLVWIDSNWMFVGANNYGVEISVYSGGSYVFR